MAMAVLHQLLMLARGALPATAAVVCSHGVVVAVVRWPRMMGVVVAVPLMLTGGAMPPTAAVTSMIVASFRMTVAVLHCLVVLRVLRLFFRATSVAIAAVSHDFLDP